VNGYNFTEGVRKVLAMAREEAVRLHHEYVGTEHMLLAMLRHDEGMGMSVLTALDADTDALRAQIETTVKTGKATSHTGPDLPYTNRAKVVLEMSMKEARDLGHSYVGSEHLLLGLLREEKGIAAQVLTGAGVTLEGAREEVLEQLGTPSPAPRARATGVRQPAERGAPTLIVVEIRYEGGWTQRREFRTTGEARAFLAAR
jgi:ATP-dependent Clp protease ATP-binding subunit ClpC